ncbi:MAG: zinc ribbon domain-containing protein [Sedimentisphaerales bacterium]|nr:zinc ribbon domain-containing protein [Sedimentisphaerales bacterium]
MNRSLIKNCKACGKEISKYSPFCRHCGHPQGFNLMIWLLTAFLIIVLAAYTAFMCYCSRHPEKFTTPENIQLPQEKR